MACKLETQNDEFFCQTCHLRWAIDEDSPCVLLLAKEPPVPPTSEARQLRIAKCIVGPTPPDWMDREKTLELRDHKWAKIATKAERDDAMIAAAAIIEELKIP
jgi:hypothetical protein